MRSTDATETLLRTLTPFVHDLSLQAPWGVGYSGGRDSAVLLWAMAQIVPPSRVVALHVDHGWRPAPEREAEAAVVRGWCQRLGVSLRSFGPPPEPPDSEAAARAYRYQCFSQFGNDSPGSPIFLGHHADDQAETILMRLLRGRSWQGLGGMPVRRGRYLRPFLSVRRSLLAEVANQQGIPAHEDSSNDDVRFSRNFLRHRVLPLVQGRFPRAVEALGDFGRLWGQVGPPGDVAPEWSWGEAGASVPGVVWDRWSPLVRQAQLLAVAEGLQAPGSLTRRFLEGITVSGRTRPAQGAGWRWTRQGGSVQWTRPAPSPVYEYFVQATPGGTYDLGAYQMTWVPEGSLSAADDLLFVPGPRPDRPWIWRSAVIGMPFASQGNLDWGKDTRRRRVPHLQPDRCALVIQEGLIRAVVDPRENRVVWAETGLEKLHKTGIFVKLRQRSDYERR